MRTNLGWGLMLLLLAACAEQTMTDSAPPARSGSPNYAVGQPAATGGGIQPSTRGRN
jgi:hypothetical protein